MANRKTKIICTINPASENKEMMAKLVENGMNTTHSNLSHGDFEEHGDRIRNIREVAREAGGNIAILLDIKGPEVRLGESENGVETYEEGDMVTIVREEVLGIHEESHTQYPEVFDDVEVGGTILIDDGRIHLTILEKRESGLKCRIENLGQLKSRKGCSLPGMRLSVPFISPKDNTDIRFGCQIGVDHTAASFIRRKEDILAIHKILREERKPDIQIIPKIENQRGFGNPEETLEVADGVMVTRDDLGVDVSFELVPIHQKGIIRTANTMGKPVVTATHMLESMQGNPRPTRTEANDIANAMLGGTDAIMLSGESAAGLYPIKTVQIMDRITKAMGPTVPLKDRLKASIEMSQRAKNDAIAISVVSAAMALDVAAVITLTQSGITARRISKFRPETPTIAVIFDGKTQRSLAMDWGATAAPSEIANNQSIKCGLARAIAKEMGIRVGETIIIVAGYPVGNGAANTMETIEVK